MTDVNFCVEYTKPGSTGDKCIVCGSAIVTKGSLKIGCYSGENQEEKQWYHSKCFWQDHKYVDILKQEDPNFPSFEGYMDLKSTDKQKIVSSLKEFQKENSPKDSGETRGLKRSTTYKGKAASSSSSCRLTPKSTIGDADRQEGPRGKHMFRIHEDSLKYLQIKQFKKGVFVVLNEFYLNDSDNSWLPTSPGIRLSIEEWEDLYKGRSVIDNAITTAEKITDEPPQKKRREIAGIHASCVGDSVVVALYLSETRPVCVRTLFENGIKKVEVGIGFQESITFVDGKPSAPYYLPVSLTPEEWANLVQLRPEVNEDLMDNFDIYCVDI
ncbi:uncharacterized protein LOC117330547 [Pecten maximus]|uniref:uncharacterized protein LOC117330547 n=1 Tax=Pecten maximus TaxID=6579 RepID=UPI0014584A50|nr:uncharacterized protein LOC117330547 [Pecten maximus]